MYGDTKVLQDSDGRIGRGEQDLDDRIDSERGVSPQKIGQASNKAVSLSRFSTSHLYRTEQLDRSR